MLQVETKIATLRALVRGAKAKGKRVGFVPTMGALHEGHARLVELCREESGFVLVSIFVNPTQFGPNEDFERYPRTLEADLRVCETAGADLVFVPEVAEIYPRGREHATFVEVPVLSHLLEGVVRPTHFRGVATVVLKLFNMTEPDLAFFGAKDYQQQLLIRCMVADLNLPVEIRTVETVREADGLAMSSRNRYLDPVQRGAAGILYKALTSARAAVRQGERDANRVRQVLTETLESQREVQVDYAEVADAETLAPLTELSAGRRAVGLIAVRLGTTRLIDNAILTD